MVQTRQLCNHTIETQTLPIAHVNKANLLGLLVSMAQYIHEQRQILKCRGRPNQLEAKAINSIHTAIGCL